MWKEVRGSGTLSPFSVPRLINHVGHDEFTEGLAENNRGFRSSTCLPNEYKVGIKPPSDLGVVTSSQLSILVGTANMYLASPLLLLPCFASLLLSSPAPARPQTGDVRTVYQFPNSTWLENLAVRRNGKILATLITTPDLYQIDPFSAGTPAKLILTFASSQSLLGITETEPDVFAVVSGNLSFAAGGTPGSFAVWSVNVRKTPAVVKKIASIPEAKLLNGITLLDATKGTVLIADSSAGVVYRLDTRTGKYKVVIDNELFKGSQSSPFSIGVNGLKIMDFTLFFTNSQQHILGSVPITTRGTAIGPFKTIVRNTAGLLDDFALAPNGDAYVTLNSGNQLAKVTPAGVLTEVAGDLNSTILAGPTAAQLGRTFADRRTVYVTTSGGLAEPVNGTIVVGGAVVAVEV